MSKNPLINAKCRVLITDPWYGIFISRFKWKKDSGGQWFNEVPTIGVRFTTNGYVECLYNSEWIATLTMEETMGVLKHEVEHIVRMHPSRARYYKNNVHHHGIWNIAIDWVINGTKKNPRIANLPKCGCYIPDKNNKDDVNKWKGCNLNALREDMTAEEFYDWLKDNTTTNKVSNGGGSGNSGSNSGSNSSGSGNGELIVIKTLGGRVLDVVPMDNHGGWDDSNISPEDMRRIAKDLVNTATHHAGKAPGHLEESIASLEKPQHNWVYKFRQFIGRMVGGKRKTYSRRNRRNDQFGVKGVSSHAAIKLVIGVDTSGSMSDKMLRKVFSEIEQMSQYFKIRLVQFDHGVQDVSEYHRGDWRKIKLKGRGGTNFELFFKYIEEHGLVGQMNLVLTDGFDVLPAEREYPVTWVIVGKQGIQHLGGKKNIWGDVVLIENDYEEPY